MFYRKLVNFTSREINSTSLHADVARGEQAALLISNQCKYIIFQMENEYTRLLSDSLFLSRLDGEIERCELIKKNRDQAHSLMTEIRYAKQLWLHNHDEGIDTSERKITKSFLAMKVKEAHYEYHCYNRQWLLCLMSVSSLLYYPLIKCIQLIANSVHLSNTEQSNGRHFSIKDILILIYSNSYVDMPFDNWSWNVISIYNHPILDIIEKIVVHELILTFKGVISLTTQCDLFFSKVELEQSCHQIAIFRICLKKASDEGTITNDQSKVYSKENLLITILLFLVPENYVEEMLTPKNVSKKRKK
jgi:hypothetical protein